MSIVDSIRRARSFFNTNVIDRLSADKILRLFELLSYVATVLGLAFIVLQLQSDENARRLSSSMEMVNRFNTEPVSDNVGIINRFAFSRRSELETISQRGGFQDIVSLQRWTENEVEEFSKGAGNEDIYIAIYQISSFFLQMKSCVDSQVCDREVLIVHFSGFAGDFDKTYGSIISEMESSLGNPDLRAGIVFFKPDSTDAHSS